MNGVEPKLNFLDKFYAVGSEKFYNFLLTYSIDKLRKMQDHEYDGISPETELLDYYEKILSVYRSGIDEDHLELAKIFRKAAHKIYRIGLKQKLIKKNKRFLNLV